MLNRVCLLLSAALVATTTFGNTGFTSFDTGYTICKVRAAVKIALNDFDVRTKFVDNRKNAELEIRVHVNGVNHFRPNGIPERETGLPRKS